MALAKQVGELLIGAARLISTDLAPKTSAVVLSATRPDRAKFVAPTSNIDPSAKLGVNSSVWFNSRIGAGTKVGNGACILDGAIIEENCTIGDMSIIRPGAVIKKGSIIGARAIVGVGAVVPERSNIKDSTVLVDGWNGSSVKESTVNSTAAEEEALHAYQLASQHNVSWSRPIEEREKALSELESERANPEPSEKWEQFVSVHPNPNKNPERRGVVFDK